MHLASRLCPRGHGCGQWDFWTASAQLADFVADEELHGSRLASALYLIRRENDACDSGLVVGVMVDGEFVELDENDLIDDRESLDARSVAEAKLAKRRADASE